MIVRLLDFISSTTQRLNIAATQRAIRAALLQPAANPRLSMLVLAIAVVFILIVVLLIMLLATPRQRRILRVRHYTAAPTEVTETAEKTAEPVEPVSQPISTRLFLALTSPLAVGLLVAISMAGAYALTSSDSYCALTCHAQSDFSASAGSTKHARCVSCHESGPLAFVANTSSRTRMIWLYARGDRGLSHLTAVIDPRSCQACHKGIEETTTVSATGLRMSHKEVISAGRPCTQCHLKTGHRDQPIAMSVNTCFPCHDSRQASSECISCHARQNAATLREVSRKLPAGSGHWKYPAVRVQARQCGGCHDQKRECDSCHGLRMPHSSEFIEGGHSPSAAFERKKVCWKCHDPQFCSNTSCHSAAFDPLTGNTTHGADWKREHASGGWDAGCVCHAARNARVEPICTLCHLPDHSLKPQIR